MLFHRAEPRLLYFVCFQAEAGIRDFHVTGVQTCALPIFEGLRAAGVARRESPGERHEPLHELLSHRRRAIPRVALEQTALALELLPRTRGGNGVHLDFCRGKFIHRSRLPATTGQPPPLVSSMTCMPSRPPRLATQH